MKKSLQHGHEHLQSPSAVGLGMRHLLHNKLSQKMINGEVLISRKHLGVGQLQITLKKERFNSRNLQVHSYGVHNRCTKKMNHKKDGIMCLLGNLLVAMEVAEIVIMTVDVVMTLMVAVAEEVAIM